MDRLQERLTEGTPVQCPFDNAFHHDCWLCGYRVGQSCMACHFSAPLDWFELENYTPFVYISPNTRTVYYS